VDIAYEASPPMFRNHPLWFIACVLLIAVFGLGIILLMYWYIQTRSTRLTITSTDLAYEVGIFSKTRIEVRLPNIRTVKVTQTFMQRIFNTGDIELYTSGDNPEVVTKGMPDPEKVREIVNASRQPG
jgi:uncharacterized membrane protein YdbT with pleckstrin-like domain